jgi:hypothetical protein
MTVLDLVGWIPSVWFLVKNELGPCFNGVPSWVSPRCRFAMNSANMQWFHLCIQIWNRCGMTVLDLVGWIPSVWFW